MTTDTESGDAPNPMEDAETWQSLSRNEQSDILDEGLADLRGDRGEGSWRHLSDDEQRRTVSAIERADGGTSPEELSDAERAMREATSATWTAEVFADLEDVPTVPFECRELTSEEQGTLTEVGQVVMGLEQQAASLDDEDVEDIDDLEAAGLELESETFDSLEDIDAWISSFLGEVTTAPEFDAERFRTGRNLRANTRKLLFVEIFLRYHEESERAVRFRTE